MSGGSSSDANISKTRSAAATVLCSTLEALANCVIGRVKERTYWMKAWISPTVIIRRIANQPPRMTTATYPRLPIRPITGIMMLEKNCAFQAAPYSVSL